MFCRWIWIVGLGFALAGFACFPTNGRWGAPACLAQAAGGAYIGTDERSGDSVIRIGPPGETRPGTRIYMDRNPVPDDDVADRVIHVVPPPEEARETEVFFGPLLITPDITWPETRKPRTVPPGFTTPGPDSRRPQGQAGTGRGD